MEKHVTLLGWFYIACGVLGILFAFIVFIAVVGGGFISGDREAIRITMIVGTAVASFLTLISIPGIIAGIGLLNRREWARILAIILGVLKLINIPFGTALGIYTLWALMQDETVRIFSTVPGSRQTSIK